MTPVRIVLINLVQAQERKEYYSNGNIQSVSTYEDGKKADIFKNYYENGQLSKVGSYEMSLLIGEGKHFNNKKIMEKKFKNQLSEAEQNFKGSETINSDTINDDGFKESTQFNEEISAKGPGSGLIYLGNFLGGNIKFTITGRKYGQATKEVHVLLGRKGKWLYGWDTGSEEIVIIHTDYRNDTATYSPFYGCAHVWYQICR